MVTTSAIPLKRRAPEEWEKHPERFRQVCGRFSRKWLLVRRETDEMLFAEAQPWPNVEIFEAAE